MLLRSVFGSSRYARRWRPYHLLLAAVTASLAVLTSSVPAAPVHAVAAGRARVPVASTSSVPATAVPVPAGGSPSAKAPGGGVSAGPPGSFTVVQMNLCNSGMERSCYAFGRSVDQAAANILHYRPDLVTVQEVCRGDLYAPNAWGKIPQAMADLYGSDHVVVDFVPAMDRGTGDGIKCLNGQYYGIALIHHGDGRDVHYGWYTEQDSSGEIRAWTCITVIVGLLTGCTTHLSMYESVAMRQCHELMSTLASSWVLPDVIVAADFNVAYQPGKAHNVQSCVPPGYDRRGDNSLQHVLFSHRVQWLQGGYAPMRWTDHPVLYETFRV